MTVDKKAIKKILVLRYRSIGDLILSNPALASLRETFPEARVDFVVDEAFSSLFYKNPNIDNVIPFKKRPKGAGKAESLFHELRFIKKIRAERYDMAVDLHCGPRSAMLTWLSGAPFRLGYPFRLRNRIFYNIHAPYGAESPHSVDVMLRILEPLGPVKLKEKKLFLACREEDKKFARDFLTRHHIFPGDTVMVIHPGAAVDFRRVPVEKMGEVLRWLCAETGVKPVLAGTERERDFIMEMQRIAGVTCPTAVNFTLGRFTGLLDACDLFMGNDSGPMHMAAALKKRIVAFFGPVSPDIWAPWETTSVVLRTPTMDCMPCSQYTSHCPYVGDHCMARIRTEDIKNAVLSLLRPARAGA